MKIQTLLLLLVSICLCGCRAPKPAPVAVAAERAVGDIYIRSAVFGVGLDTADVTDRVAYLLRTEPEGFKAERDWLHVDPAPYKAKALVIDYEYNTRPYRIIITGAKEKVTPELLRENAQK